MKVFCTVYHRSILSIACPLKSYKFVQSSPKRTFLLNFMRFCFMFTYKYVIIYFKFIFIDLDLLVLKCD